jgi:hypothetical protein
MARQLLTDFELMILLAIPRIGKEAYGVPIAQEIETTGGRPVLLPAVYAASIGSSAGGWSSPRWGILRRSAAAAPSASSASRRRGCEPPGRRSGRSSPCGRACRN